MGDDPKPQSDGAALPVIPSGASVDDVSVQPPLIPGTVGVEDVRATLAYFLAFIYAGTILGAFILLFISKQYGKPDWTDVKDLVTTILSAETALFGTVLGFYFGGKT